MEIQYASICWLERSKHMGIWGVEWIQMTQGHGPEAGSCEQGNEHSSSIKRGEFLNQLTERWLLNKDSAPRSSKNT